MYSTAEELSASDPDADASGPATPGPAGADPNWLRGAEVGAWRAFVECATDLLTSLDRALLDDAGLTLSEYRILVLLSESSTLRMSDLSEGAVASRSTISRQVSRLVDNGAIERLPDTNDARNRLVRITPRGMALLQRAAVDHVRRVRSNFLDHIDPADLPEVERVFDRIRLGLHER
ncbi:MarR family winged helix-turn-helix transcriptional regulator [Williamsia sp. CHRR-6]|uniref:MarR family winged helix-turn-helix transcriptional regulator n=1 Tax=Williamsia sp. CHRR-6 TaxID=2835871 RepID=UPI001BD9EB28|nr:MarR family transcriptional regulator [Williamsia sp. CHRR-6]MBT0567367.1 MarR family transcriptional regulator [Williamsia sp. CHRR-6]